MSLSSVSFSGAQAKPAFGAQQKTPAKAIQPAVNFGQGEGAQKQSASQPQVRFGVLPPDGLGGMGILGCLLACCACIALPILAIGFAAKKGIGGLVNKAKNLVPKGGQ